MSSPTELPRGPGQPRSLASALIGRIVFGMAALVVVVLGFFFLAAALVAGAILAAVVLVRFWLLKRKLEKAAEREFITTEYTVVERERPPDPRLPPER